MKRSVWDKTPTQLTEHHVRGGTEATSLVAVIGVGGGAKVTPILSGQGARIRDENKSAGRVKGGKILVM